ncbi:MAG: GNAT family N-acetyltransferase [Bacteroidota bacterium]
MIRNITEKDFDYIFELYMHPLINPFLLYEIMDKEAFMPIFEDLLNRNIIFIFSENGTDIGMFKLVPQLHRNSHTNYLGGVAIHPDFAGKGFAKKMFAEILELGQNRGLIRMELSTATFNHNAIKLYEKMGFVTEGIMKKHTFLKSENRYVDEQLMAYLY